MYKLTYAIGYSIGYITTAINYSFHLACIMGKTAAHNMFMRIFNH